MMRLGIILVLLSTTFTSVHSQDLGLNFVNGLPESYINPAFDTDKTFIIGLGSRMYDLGNESFTLEDAFVDAEGGKALDFSRIVDKVNADNLIRFNEDLKTFEFGYKMGQTIVYGGHSWKLNASANYSSELIQLLAFGNEPYIGQTLTIGPKVAFTSYNETYLGFSSGNEKFRFGVRAKLLNGAQNVQSGSSKLALSTGEEIYRLTLDSDYEVFSSGVVDYRGIDDFDVNAQRLNFDHFLSANWGYGLDIGLSIRLGNAEILMSGVDLGQIKWTQNANRYFSNERIEFEGLDINDFIGSDTDYSIEDSLKSLINLNEEAVSYTTSTNGKIYIGGKYKINDLYRVGAVLKREVTPVDNTYAFMINGQRKVGKYFEIGLSATYQDGSIANLGGQIMAEVGPVMVYAVAHNAIAALLPEQFNSISIRFGGQIRFNKRKKSEDVDTDI